MAEAISIEGFRELFVIDSEFAVIDPRNAVDFAAGHLLAASNLPLRKLDSLIGMALPLKSTLCVLCDAGAGEAASAAALLESLGYSNVAILDGGLEAWRVSGGVVFSGVSVPGKAFGEFIESECATPVMTVAQLRARQQSGAKTLLIDSRTAEEHASYCIPGAILCPGAELVYRVLPVIQEDTDIVVHCGGRTRSIIGAQTLIDAGCERVYALENGTMAWQFEGLELEYGNQSALPKPEAEALPGIREVAAHMASRWYVDRVSSIPLQTTGSRYLVDVRSLEEYEAGHIPGSLHVPGGHLLQNVDRYLVVRNAMVILIDADRVRASSVAIWLRRMGWRRVFVFSLDDDKKDLEFGPGTIASPLEDRDLDPRDYDDPEALMRENRAYLEWEIALLGQLPGEPAAPYYGRE
ncbi:MAG: thiosulfate sulfurtransferase [Gammaproteobacteria bacterium]|nr:thiosulfate sulfurtransferase [Gammaproteobacteria bacterium]